MKRSVFVVLFWLISSIFTGNAQGFNQIRTADTYDLIPQEGIYIHQNNSLLFAGDRLYYKVYCLELESNQLSSLSKIAYVSLVDANLQTVFSHKIRLSDGTGSGDIAIPTEIPTGSYKLVGYTSWMQNREQMPYFESDLVVINPYKVTPEQFLETRETDTTQLDSLIPVVPKQPTIIAERESLGAHLIDLSTDRADVGIRSPLKIEINALRPSAIGGDYSISVNKVDSTLPQVKETSLNVWRNNRGLTADRNEAQQVLPELRGELISGQLTSKENNQPVAGRSVILSLPGDPYIMDIAHTNEQGRFYFNLDTPVSGSLAIFQVLGADKDEFAITTDDPVRPDLKSLEFTSFTIDRNLENEILNRSIHNQIENAYGIVKSDTLIRPEEDTPFYREYQQRFFLDDYTRFNTLRETMVEIVDHAWISENGDDDPTFNVRPYDGYLDVNALQPIVLMDGLFIQDHKDIVDYNSKELRSIYVSRDRYMVGPEVFQGLLALETKAGEFQNTFYRSHLYNSELFRPEAPRSYYFQDHGPKEDSGRVPDFRYQLYWTPKIELGSETTSIEIYTSDIKGSFEVELKGFTANGEAVDLRIPFNVE